MTTIERHDDTQAEFAEGTLTGVQTTTTPSLALAYQPVLSFDGADDYVEVLDDVELRLGTSDFTISWLEKPASGSSSDNNNVRLDKGGVYVSGSIYFYEAYNGLYRLRIGGSDVFQDHEIDFDIWSFLSIVRDGDNIIFYKNGIELGSYSGWGNSVIDSLDNLFFGSEGGATRFFEGSILGVSIWNTALTQQEIQDNMYKELTGNETGLVAYYKLNEGSGTTVTDSAGSNDGTITGATWQTSNTFYLSNGNRVTPNIDLTSANLIRGSTISWIANLNSQGITIESRVSTDGGSTWTAWEQCYDGGSIPTLPANSLLQIRQNLSTTDMSVTPELISLDIVIELANGYISGTVKEEGTAVQRTVRVYLRSDGHLVQEVTSATDGTFTAYTATLDEHYAVALDDTGDATDYNALIFDRIVPESV